MFDTLRLSTLECFYDREDCFRKLLKAINQSIIYLTLEIPFHPVRPLVNDDMFTQFAPTTLLSVIIDSMMIERWNVDSSFDQYYDTCQPRYCTYLYTFRDHSILSIITSLVSLAGGLSASLRFIVPLLINLLFHKREPKRQTTQQGNLFLVLSDTDRRSITVLSP